ncbi:MAG: nucleobase:cation symporter, family [Solirubrobacteraceae bacterium]|jgi:purine-cytosine permease-like protein|nr:nucleobase:cation symporter, family [Solirubrobacteraceae bacterium]
MATQTADAPALGEIERRSIDWVPDDERHGKLWHQGPLWFLGNFQYFSIPIGFIGPALGLSLGWTILAGTLGILTGTVFMAFHAAQGPTLGLPQMIQSRAQFGYRGVIVPLFATLFTYLAFNVADQVLLADGLKAAFGWNPDVVAVTVAVLAAVIAIYGHDWVHRVFRALLVVSLPLMLIVTFGVLFGFADGAPPKAELGFTWAAFMAQFSAAAAYNITYAPYVSDYSRYLPRTTRNRSIIVSVFLGASGAAIWLIAIGAFLAIRLGASDGLLGIKTAGDNIGAPLGSLVAFFLAASLAATMGMNAYGGMLTVLTGLDSLKGIRPTRRARVITILVLTVVWFVVGKSISTDAVGTLFSALTLMLYLLVPWTATNLVDFFFVRRGHYAIADLFTPSGIYGAWSWRGLVAYGAGFLAEIPFMVVPDINGHSFTGPIAKQISSIDLAWIVGLAVSAVVYIVLSRSMDVRAEARAVESSDAQLAGAAT